MGQSSGRNFLLNVPQKGKQWKKNHSQKKRHANISEKAIKTAKKVRAAPDFFLKLFKMVSWSLQIGHFK